MVKCCNRNAFGTLHFEEIERNDALHQKKILFFTRNSYKFDFKIVTP